MTKRETAISALLAKLIATFPTMNVGRNVTYESEMPSAGLINLRDGDTVEEEPLLSPLQTTVTHVCEVEIFSESESQRDSLIQSLSAAIAADRLLSGSVEWSSCNSPEFESDISNAGNPVHSASVGIVMTWTVAGDPSS